MTSTREALQRIATGRRVTKHQLAELERDGHIHIGHDGVISITESGTTILTERKQNEHSPHRIPRQVHTRQHR